MAVKRFLVGCMLAASCAASTGAQSGAPPTDPDAVPRVTVDDFRTRLARRAILAIDVRDPHSFESGHIPGAKNVSFVDVEIRANGLRKQPLPIVAYCA